MNRTPMARAVARMAASVAAAAALAPSASAQTTPQTTPQTAPQTTPQTARQAAQPPEDTRVARVEITGRHHDNTVGSADAASQGVIRAELLRSRPALRPGEVLEFVPGVIVTQHSGDGKANQYFLRGFNLDHGTDFATSVNGLPVNMPSHGHGQGYSDLNFLLPELVDRIAYRKGPYFAQNGDFASAGSADIVYRTRLDAPFASLTLGGNGYRRGVLGGSTRVAGDLTLLGALELQRNDGPWTVPEGLHKTNAVFTLSGGTAADGWQASAMHYAARWTATDQIPQRLVDAGSFDGKPFGLFDSLDPSTGGDTRRSSLSAQWQRTDAGGTTRLAAYLIDYRLDLFSNFTYALERPLAGSTQGDQFAQHDDRRVAGLSASRTLDHQVAGLNARSEVGLQLRHDRVHLGLFNTVARQVTATVREDRVRQTQLGLYGQTVLELAPWLRAIAGLRADQQRMHVDSLTLPANAGRSSASQLSPKLSLVLGPWAKTEFFINAGRGMHSNDARGTTDAVQPVPGLVASRGFEVGARSEWLPGLNTSLALWTLDIGSELVYVGDAGTTEPSRPSRRRGIEWNNRWAPLPWLLVDADLAWTHARLRGNDPANPAAGDRIPNSVDKVASVAVSAHDLGPWSASLQWRYLGSGPLTEDNSVRAPSALTTNLRLGWRVDGRTDLTLDVFNLGNRRVNDISYFYESRLPNEADPVADRHLHPAEPRTVRLTLAHRF